MNIPGGRINEITDQEETNRIGKINHLLYERKRERGGGSLFCCGGGGWRIMIGITVFYVQGNLMVSIGS